jgi:hypothetical protein
VPKVKYAFCAQAHAPQLTSREQLAVGYGISATIPMMPRAVAAEGVVDPARSVTDGRTPKRLAENSADNSSGDRANRTSDDKARARSGGGANHVGAGHGRNHWRNHWRHHRDCNYGR